MGGGNRVKLWNIIYVCPRQWTIEKSQMVLDGNILQPGFGWLLS